MEDLDETLNESVRDSITGRSQAAREARAAKAERAKRRRQQLEDEEEAGASPWCRHTPGVAMPTVPALQLTCTLTP